MSLVIMELLTQFLPHAGVHRIPTSLLFQDSMDNIIFEHPSKRVSHKNKVGSNVVLSVARYDMAIEQAPQPINPYFSHDTNFNVHIYSKELVSLFDIFLLSGDEELGNKDLTNGSPQTLSQGNINS